MLEHFFEFSNLQWSRKRKVNDMTDEQSQVDPMENNVPALSPNAPPEKPVKAGEMPLTEANTGSSEEIAEIGEESSTVTPHDSTHEGLNGPVVAEQGSGEGAVGALSTEAILSIEKAVNAGINHIMAAFEAKLAYDATKQVQIDRLHEELLQHRSYLAARAARPLVHGMIRLHDDIGKLLAALRTKPTDDLTPDRFFSLLEGIQEDVEILLDQNSVAAFREPSGPFNPRRQRVLKKVATTKESLAGTVAESIRPGFEQGTEILEKERVATFELVQPTACTPSEPSSEAPEGQIPSSEDKEKEN